MFGYLCWRRPFASFVCVGVNPGRTAKLAENKTSVGAPHPPPPPPAMKLGSAPRIRRPATELVTPRDREPQGLDDPPLLKAHCPARPGNEGMRFILARMLV